jgi:hypothetical protein
MFNLGTPLFNIALQKQSLSYTTGNKWAASITKIFYSHDKDSLPNIFT